jgi:hypothetical protein
MHPRHRLLGFLLFNLLWAIALFSFVCRSNSSRPVSFTGLTVTAAERAALRQAREGGLGSAPESDAPPSRREFTWRDLESEEYVTYLRQLRAAGCPDVKVRQIILSDVNERASSQRLEIALANDARWWRADAVITTLPAFPDVNQAFEQERGALLEKLLGPRWAESDRTAPLQAGGVLLAGQVLGSLSPEKHNAVQEILAASSARQQDYLLTCSNEGRLPNPVETARQREQERSDLSQVLSSLELEEFLIRYSHNARQLRQELGAFEPTAVEFRKVYQALDPIDRRMQLDYGDTSALSAKQRQDYEGERDRAIQHALSPQRYVAYRQTQVMLR